MLTLWHNPRCSKSRQALAILEASGQPFETLRYLDTPQTLEDISGAFARLGLDHPRGMMRTGERIYKELNLKNVVDPKVLLQAMVDHPILIERPILDDGTQAVIGRPPEKVNEIL